jgi:hypothetical protein
MRNIQTKKCYMSVVMSIKKNVRATERKHQEEYGVSKEMEE